MMIRIGITEDHLRKQKSWSSFKGNRHTFRTDGGNVFVGDLAEVVFQEMYPDAKRISEVDYEADFVWHGERIDVKAKQRNCRCQPNYSCSVERRQRNLNCDWYAFFSLNQRNNEIEFLGWRDKISFFDNAESWNVGETDDTNNWKSSSNSASIPVSKLWTEEQRESIIERAAIMEFDSGIPRLKAMEMAIKCNE
jgi:hypothetical protein